MLNWILSLLLRTLLQTHFLQSGLLIGACICIGYILMGRWEDPTLAVQTFINPRMKYSPRSFFMLMGMLFFSSSLPYFQNSHILNFFPFESIDCKWISLSLGGILIGTGTFLSQKRVDKNEQFSSSVALDSIYTRPSLFLLSYFTATLVSTYGVIDYIPKNTLYSSSIQHFNSEQIIMIVVLFVPFVSFVLGQNKYLKVLVEKLIFFSVGFVLAYAHMILLITKPNVFGSQFKVNSQWNITYMASVLLAFSISKILIKIMSLTKAVPLFTLKIMEGDSKISFRQILGSIFIGLGWAIGKISILTFILIVPHTTLKIVLCWGVPCFGAIKLLSLLFK